ncbi:CaiB/BaiF CoA-transferase family protein [Neobacillus niacini]|uniref:CaiB/BaiF CoA transferase family protein n=1 Tax=Neobacillus niacini TaxID=86668 RepID=UPI0007ABB4CC|nr:CaiB/BaiF CoA-transferase family protein [Neobacillus niacini]MEC1525016.1 CaiB/BaiF CoA-transferase family protein [Neobacillus niacini]
MLKGVRVIDFSQYLPGPYATLRLADKGAEVIKVESPSGDPSRYPPEKDQGDKYIFRAQNRDKRSISLNLKDPNDQRIAIELIKESDVVLESFRPGVTKRLGFAYEDIVKVKPDIIYCSLSGYGQKGVISHLGSHDINYMALSGALSQLKDNDGVPVHPSHTFADLIGGIAASESISAALFHRERTGEGSYIDLSLADVMLSLMTNHIILESATGEQNGISKLNKELICYYLYETKDGRYISLGALEPKFWENFCSAVNKIEWLPAHLTKPSDDNLIFQEVKKMFRKHTLSEWTQFAEKVDCCMAPVLETGEVPFHPYYQERHLIEEKWGLRYVSTHYSPEPKLKYSSPPPKHGEHNKEIIERSLKN